MFAPTRVFAVRVVRDAVAVRLRRHLVVRGGGGGGGGSARVLVVVKTRKIGNIKKMGK